MKKKTTLFYAENIKERNCLKSECIENMSLSCVFHLLWAHCISTDNVPVSFLYICAECEYMCVYSALISLSHWEEWHSVIKDMNCSLIFRGQLNYPFQLIFSFAGCASYGSFNVSSVCVLITHCNRIYNSLWKMHIRHYLHKWDRDFPFLLLSLFLLYMPWSGKHKSSCVLQQVNKITFQMFF